MFIHLQLLVMTAKRGDNPFPSTLIKNANTGKKVLDGIDKGNKSELKQLARQETTEQHRAVLEKFRELLAEDVKPHNLVSKYVERYGSGYSVRQLRRIKKDL